MTQFPKISEKKDNIGSKPSIAGTLVPVGAVFVHFSECVKGGIRGAAESKKSLRQLVEERSGMDFEAYLRNNPFDARIDYAEFDMMGGEEI